MDPLGPTSDVGFSGDSGKDVVAAFVANVTGGSCLEGIDASGYLDNGCTFLGDELSLVPRQPRILPIGGGYAAVAIATTAPCTQGDLIFRWEAPGISGAVDAPCALQGASLPSAIALSDGATALVGYYATSLPSRSDPISDCGAALAAPLIVETVMDAAGESPRLGAMLDLADDGVGMRPPAMLALANGEALVAAPHEDAVGVWSLKGSLSPASPSIISGLKYARAVSMATDRASGLVAVVAEIGCAPQSIALAIGDGSSFPVLVDVAPMGNDLAVQPTVAWVDDQDAWLVSWITSVGGGQPMARWFDANGSALGGPIAPTVPASAATATSSGGLLAFLSEQSAFVDMSIGCVPRFNP